MHKLGLLSLSSTNKRLRINSNPSPAHLDSSSSGLNTNKERNPARRISNIESANVLPSTHKVLVRHLRDQAARDERPRIDLKNLTALRKYNDYRVVVETERLRHIEKQHSDPEYMEWLNDE